jgi:hypothetical protein
MVRSGATRYGKRTEGMARKITRQLRNTSFRTLHMKTSHTEGVPHPGNKVHIPLPFKGSRTRITEGQTYRRYAASRGDPFESAGTSQA